MVWSYVDDLMLGDCLEPHSGSAEGLECGMQRFLRSARYPHLSLDLPKVRTEEAAVVVQGVVSRGELSEEQQGGVRCGYRLRDVASMEEVKQTSRVWTRRLARIIVPLVFHGAPSAPLRASGDSTHKVPLAFRGATGQRPRCACFARFMKRRRPGLVRLQDRPVQFAVGGGAGKSAGRGHCG